MPASSGERDFPQRRIALMDAEFGFAFAERSAETDRSFVEASDHAVHRHRRHGGGRSGI